MFSKAVLASSVLALGISQALAAGVQFAGVNIAGFDFGCGTDVCLILITLPAKANNGS